MDITLPKWMASELHKDTDRSLQYLIKLILKEYINDTEFRDKVRRIEGYREEGRKE